MFELADVMFLRLSHMIHLSWSFLPREGRVNKQESGVDGLLVEADDLVAVADGVVEEGLLEADGHLVRLRPHVLRLPPRRRRLPTGGLGHTHTHQPHRHAHPHRPAVSLRLPPLLLILPLGLLAPNRRNVT